MPSFLSFFVVRAVYSSCHRIQYHHRATVGTRHEGSYCAQDDIWESRELPWPDYSRLDLFCDYSLGKVPGCDCAVP